MLSLGEANQPRGPPAPSAHGKTPDNVIKESAACYVPIIERAIPSHEEAVGHAFRISSKAQGHEVEAEAFFE